MKKENQKRRRDGSLTAKNSDSTLYWYKNDLQHRVRGPAVIDGSNKFQWWFRGEQIQVNSQDEYEEWLKANHPFNPEVTRLF